MSGCGMHPQGHGKPISHCPQREMTLLSSAAISSLQRVVHGDPFPIHPCWNFDWFDSCIGNHHCFKVMCVTAMSCAEVSMSQLSSLGVSFYVLLYHHP